MLTSELQTGVLPFVPLPIFSPQSRGQFCHRPPSPPTPTPSAPRGRSASPRPLQHHGAVFCLPLAAASIPSRPHPFSTARLFDAALPRPARLAPPPSPQPADAARVPFVLSAPVPSTQRVCLASSRSRVAALPLRQPLTSARDAACRLFLRAVGFLSRCKEFAFPREPYIGVPAARQPIGAQNVSLSSRRFRFPPLSLLASSFPLFPSGGGEVGVTWGSPHGHLWVTRPSRALPPVPSGRCRLIGVLSSQPEHVAELGVRDSSLQLWCLFETHINMRCSFQGSTYPPT